MDATLAEAAKAGGSILKPAGETCFGRHGYFVDSDGHLWEVAWDRGLPIAEDGSLLLPDCGRSTALAQA